MELKTIQFEQSKFYNEADFDEVFIVKGTTDFEIHLSWGPSIDDKTRKLTIAVAHVICGFIQTKAVHSIGITTSFFNQYSVLLACLPCYSAFKDMYSKNANSEIRKSILKNNLNLPGDQCDTVYFYTMTQLQAFGMDAKSKSFIGFSKDPSEADIFEQILNTLGRMPSFQLAKVPQLSYISLLSLCSYKSENARTRSDEYGSYFSINNGLNALANFKDDNSLEIDEDFIFLLDALGYQIGFHYFDKSFIITNEQIEPLHNNFVNSKFNKSFTIFPPLPKGLELNVKTGSISGNPVVTSPNTIYIITMHDKIKYKHELELEVKESQSSISSGLITVLLLLLLVIFILIALGYKAYHH